MTFENDVIVSCSNSTVIRFSKLRESKYRRSEKLFLCEGLKLVREAFSAGIVSYLLIREDFDIEIISGFKGVMDYSIIRLAEKPFAKISSENSPQGIIAVCKTSIVSNDLNDLCCKRVFACNSVRDPGNLGTIIRTAASLGFETVLLSDCADIYNSKTVRSSMGALFHIGIVEVPQIIEAIDFLKNCGRRVFSAALDRDSKQLGSFKLLSDDVFVVGNEGHGLSDEIIFRTDETVFIPISNCIDSLNVAIASALILWEQSKSFSE